MQSRASTCGGLFLETCLDDELNVLAQAVCHGAVFLVAEDRGFFQLLPRDALAAPNVSHGDSGVARRNAIRWTADAVSRMTGVTTSVREVEETIAQS